MTNAEHIAQLAGDAKDVATETCRRFPKSVITSSRRDIQRQALSMAANCVKQRTWILGDAHAEPPIKATYKWSKAAMLCHNWSVSHPDAREHELAAAFVHELERLPLDELAKMSKHLAPATAGARAFDLRPDHSPQGLECKAFLHAEAARRGGTFLEREGNLEIWHWQAKA